MTWFDTLVTLTPVLVSFSAGVLLVHKAMVRTKWAVIASAAAGLVLACRAVMTSGAAPVPKDVAYSALMSFFLPVFGGLMVGIGFAERVMRVRVS